jgi:hypothetical protein
LPCEGRIPVNRLSTSENDGNKGHSNRTARGFPAAHSPIS